MFKYGISDLAAELRGNAKMEVMKVLPSRLANAAAFLSYLAHWWHH